MDKATQVLKEIESMLLFNIAMQEDYKKIADEFEEKYGPLDNTVCHFRGSIQALNKQNMKLQELLEKYCEKEE